MSEHPELLNAARDADVVNACTAGGVEHDYRPVSSDEGTPGCAQTYLRCVWCHAAACGNYGQDDPCIEPWHHEPKPHRTKSGRTWPIGGTPDEETYTP